MAKPLDAILADPFDLAARSVHADQLQTKGDPRGEFIALQLAREAGGPGNPARERALLNKHGKKWMGKLGEKFRHHVWRGGFFAGGEFKPTRASLNQLLRDPAWRLVQVLSPWSGPPDYAAKVKAAELVDRPELVSLRGVYEMPEERFVTGAERPWTEFQIGLPLREDDPQRTCTALPALDTLAVRPSRYHTNEWLESAPVLRRVRRLVMDDEVWEMVGVCEKLSGPLRELVMQTNHAPLFGGPGWRLRLLRDRAPGPFKRVVGTYEPSRYPGFNLEPLKRLDPKVIESIDLDGKPLLKPEERKFVDELLAPFANVRVGWK